MILNKSNLDITHFTSAPNVVRERFACLKLSAEFTESNLEHILEFGVFRGSTLKTITQCFPNQKIYGFDSFEGLPEDWWFSKKEVESGKSSHPKGHFGNISIPKFGDNVTLVKGFFDDSLPNFIAEQNIKTIKLLHIDSDLYSSAKTIFDLLNDFIVPGTVIVFDELHPWNPPGKIWYELWEEGEWKALKEWTEKYDREFEVLVRSQHEQCSIKVIK